MGKLGDLLDGLAVVSPDAVAAAAKSALAGDPRAVLVGARAFDWEGNAGLRAEALALQRRIVEVLETMTVRWLAHAEANAPALLAELRQGSDALGRLTDSARQGIDDLLAGGGG